MVNNFAYPACKDCLLSIVCGKLQIHGEDEKAAASAKDTKGKVRRRQAKNESGNDANLQEGKDQSSWRLLADTDSNTCFYCAVLGFAGKRGAKASSVCLVAPRPVGERSVFCTADLDGGIHVCAAIAEPFAAGYDAEKHHDELADCVHNFLSVVSGWLGAVLARQQPAVDCAAVVHHSQTDSKLNHQADGR